MITLDNYRESTNDKYRSMARLESAGIHALAVTERYARTRFDAGFISAFEYLYLTEQWTNEDFHSIVDAISNGSIEFITSAEA